MVSNPDSVWSRATATRKARGNVDALDDLFGDDEEDGEGNDQQANAADIAQKMDFDVEPRPSIHNTRPLSVMDVVFDTWDVHDDEEEEDDDDTK